ncbi:hypothetical protein [Roseimarinus sediminis]|uniref:hypothetical protein n=1 Tax=Roseimarinus sediminis TaxID=1610899 RepID=UPI003D21760B
MSKLKIMRRGIFPLRKLKITIADKVLLLKGNQTKEVIINQGLYDVYFKMDFWKAKHQILINKNEDLTIVIKHYLSDWFYIIGGSVCITLALLSIVFDLNILILSIYLVTYFTPIMYSYFIKKKYYFKVDYM